MEADRFERFFTDLVDKIRALKESGVKVSMMAEKAGLSAQTVYKLLSSERGKRPELRTALLLADSMGVPMSEILAALLPDHAIKILELHERYPALIDILFSVLKDDASEDDAEKLMHDLKYMLAKRTA